jgi:hypothetical protein
MINYFFIQKKKLFSWLNGLSPNKNKYKNWHWRYVGITWHEKNLAFYNFAIMKEDAFHVVPYVVEGGETDTPIKEMVEYIIDFKLKELKLI